MLTKVKNFFRDCFNEVENFENVFSISGLVILVGGFLLLLINIFLEDPMVFMKVVGFIAMSLGGGLLVFATVFCIVWFLMGLYSKLTYTETQVDHEFEFEIPPD